MSTALQTSPIREDFVGLTPQEQKGYFEENGFLIVPGILSPTQLASLREMTDKVLNGEIKPEIPPLWQVRKPAKRFSGFSKCWSL